MQKSNIFETESHALAESNIDKAKRVLYNVSIISRESKNNRIYSDVALDDVVHLISENGRCYLDHQLEGSRKVRELLGKYVKPRREGDRVFADLMVLEHLSNWAFDIAERMPDVMGSSIDGEALIQPGAAEDDKDLVERVTRLNSTDMVSFPATTKSLFESEGDEGTKKEVVKMEQLLRILAGLGVDVSTLETTDEAAVTKAVDTALEAIQTAKAVAVESETLKTEIETLKGQVAELTKKNEDLDKELETYRATEKEKQAREEAMKLINDAGIPKRLVSETFVKQLMKAENAEEKTALIDERKQIAEDVKGDIDLGRAREERVVADSTVTLTDEQIAERLTAAKSEPEYGWNL